MNTSKFNTNEMKEMLLSAFNGYNRNSDIIRSLAERLVILQEKGAKFYGSIAVVPVNDGVYKLVDADTADRLADIPIQLFFGNDKKSVKDAMLDKISQLQEQVSILRNLYIEAFDIEPFSWKCPEK